MNRRALLQALLATPLLRFLPFTRETEPIFQPTLLVGITSQQWSIISGTLPAGMSLSSAGVLSGTIPPN